MEKIQDNDADIMALDTGQAYFGGRYYNMMPFLAEKYSPGGAGRTISKKSSSSYKGLTEVIKICCC